MLTHRLISSVTIALRATIAGADEFFAMAERAHQHMGWLARFPYDASRGVVEHFLDPMDDDCVRAEVSRHETTERGDGRQEHRT